MTIIDLVRKKAYVILRALTAQWLATFVVGALSFLLTIVIARTMGPSLFGNYSSALAAGAVIAIFLDGGMRTVILREHSRGSIQLKDCYDELLAFALCHVLLVSFALSVLSVFIFYGDQLKLSLATVFCFMAVVFSQLISSVLRGRGDYLGDAKFQIGVRIATAVGILLSLYFGLSQPWQVIGVWSLVGFGYLMSLDIFRQKPRLSGLSRIYRASYPFFLIDIAITVYIRSNVLLFNYFNIDPALIGQYSVAFRVCEAVIMAAGPIGLLVFRHFRLTTESAEDLRPRILSLVGFALVPSILLVGAVTYASDTIVSSLFGNKYYESASHLEVLALMLLFVLPNMILNQVALGLGKERTVMYVGLGVALLNVMINVILIPAYGIHAAAWVVVATEAMIFFAMVIALFKNHSKVSLAID